ncbi:hypothetical protein C8P68_102567 [Mucilaginibacter yixingensis]|uniref:Heavy metal binding domain-containing protein n=1 Tax=Mucilaginibacter yixingensis TaxID=1295612 RepID=A0A2T5JD88_9SPHI|nr:heavy metal-binding domain-containing protein [Mucilaginibacter yixingensis]PTQ99737.1 hypothetical protein C8P68_102567 [Mucilaginibacter yixingensis]
MKKVMLMAAAILFSAVTVFAANPTTGKVAVDTTKKAKPVKVQYTCTMHPEVLSDKPGKCPKCGMTLVKKADTKKKPAEKMKM